MAEEAGSPVDNSVDGRELGGGDPPTGNQGPGVRRSGSKASVHRTSSASCGRSGSLSWCVGEVADVGVAELVEGRATQRSSERRSSGRDG